MKKRKIGMGVLLALLCTLAVGMSVSAANDTVTMKNKKWVSGKGGVFVDTDEDGVKDAFISNATAYYKIKIQKQGYILVDVKAKDLPGTEELEYTEGEEGEYWTTGVELLDSKKRGLANYSNFGSPKKNFTFSWAVKKGTYYLAVDSSQSYRLRYSFTPIAKTSKYGKSLSKAVSLKKGETVKNLMFSDKKNRDQFHYYKLKLKKKQKVTLEFDSKIISTCDNWNLGKPLNVQMYVKKGKDYCNINKKGKITKGSAFSWKVEGREKVVATLPKGTYYIRIWSLSATGYYTMKWK